MLRNNLSLFIILTLTLLSCSTNKNIGQSKDWISLFDGKTFNGWKLGENPGTFTIEDGSIKVAGPRSHLYYDGPVLNHDFKNFEFKAQVMTKPGSNSGIYFHTAFQEKGFPDKGFEVHVNNSHTDWKRTGGLYDIKDTREVFVKDDTWYTEYIRVEGKHVIVKINDQVVTDWTQPEDFVPAKNHLNRIIASGTFALQGHDPKSIVYYKDIMVKP
ncbi:MAG: 3-keto-disaccharide hydrolase, partial [Chitinophagaceae bacterium]